METFKISIFYFCVGVVLIGLIFLNFFHIELYQSFPLIPESTLPIFTFLFVCFLVFSLWQREREVLELKYEFLTIATHKFRTALTGIKWVTDLLKGDITLKEKNDFLAQIDNSLEKLMTVVDHLAGIAKFDSHLAYAFKAISLREMIDESLQRYSQHISKKNIHFDIETGEKIPLIIADAQKIQFVIDTLFENAIKYTPLGGLINAAVFSEKGYIVFVIKDSGIGLTWRERKRIFKKFFRGSRAKSADTEGLGLALFMSKTIIKHHKGKMWVKSKGKNKGSTFYVMLKTAQA